MSGSSDEQLLVCSGLGGRPRGAKKNFSYRDQVPWLSWMSGFSTNRAKSPKLCPAIMAMTPCALQGLVSQTAKCPTDYERNPTHAKLNAQIHLQFCLCKNSCSLMSTRLLHLVASFLKQSWEPKGTPPMPPPQEIAGLIKGLLTIGFP